MAISKQSFLALALIMSMATVCHAQLSVSFYNNTCPSVFDTVRSIVESAINRENRIGASILRLFFHDCFVAGCDAGVLLDDTANFEGEKKALPNNNSLRGFELIDKIKVAVDNTCGGPIVSCADILAIATRDSVVHLGGPSWLVPLGRRDARTANKDAANKELPPPFANLDVLINAFGKKGFTPREMVALSGAHSIGMARCIAFRDHLYNGTNLETRVASDRKSNCPPSGGDDNLSGLDQQSPNRFGNNYYQSLLIRRGLLHSDQQLFNGGSQDELVRTYSQDAQIFYTDFANAMIKMGNLNPLMGNNGEIRKNCRQVN